MNQLYWGITRNLLPNLASLQAAKKNLFKFPAVCHTNIPYCLLGNPKLKLRNV